MRTLSCRGFNGESLSEFSPSFSLSLYLSDFRFWFKQNRTNCFWFRISRFVVLLFLPKAKRKSGHHTRISFFSSPDYRGKVQNRNDCKLVIQQYIYSILQSSVFERRAIVQYILSPPARAPPCDERNQHFCSLLTTPARRFDAGALEPHMSSMLCVRTSVSSRSRVYWNCFSSKLEPTDRCDSETLSYTGSTCSLSPMLKAEAYTLTAVVHNAMLY